jgi:hypothetical protein
MPAALTRRRNGALSASRCPFTRRKLLLEPLRARQQQPEGRTRLRQRTATERSLTFVDYIREPKARYKGFGRTLDLRRVTVVTNLRRIGTPQRRAISVLGLPAFPPWPQSP